MKVGRLLRIGLNVTDLDRAQAFYGAALGFSAAAEHSDPALARLLGVATARVRRLQLGAQTIELTRCDPPGAAYPADGRGDDLMFQHFAIVTDDMARAYRQLQQHHFTAITQDGPQRLPAASGGAIAYKFRDPDGHPLELIEFSAPAANHPGVDHSAISVSDVASSIAFYTGLGLSLGARQVNFGPEQNRLDGLLDVRVDVVALIPPAAHTPHVELLGYRSPRGRPGAVSHPDVAATRLVFDGSDETRLVTDPDGHRLLLTP